MTASYSSGTAIGPGALDAWYQIVRSALLAHGWTAHDIITDVSGTRDIVFKSTALDATAGNACFVRMVQTNTTNMYHLTYCDWDTSTHAGTRVAGAAATTNGTYVDNSFQYFLRVNEFAFTWCVKIGTSYNRGYAGFLRRCLAASRAGMTKVTGSISAGTVAGASIALSSDMTGKWTVGQVLLLMNYGHTSGSANASHAEALTIATIGSSSVTFTGNVLAAYDAGAIIGENVYPAVVAPTPFGTYYSPVWHDGSYSSAILQVSSATGTNFSLPASNNPSSTTREYSSGIVSLNFTTAAHLGLAGVQYHWIAVGAGETSLEDTLSDGTNTYVMMSGTAAMGPT